jgi:CTP:molybdopterin cytidylyltransferase MocA
MRESLLIGLDALPADALAFFTPIDVPVVGAACIAAVRDAWIARDRDGDTPLAALPSFRRRHGHPVLAGPDFVARLFEGQRGDRVDELLAWATRRLAVVDLDDGRCVRDMDTPEDYSAFAPSPGASWDAEPPAWDVEQTLEIKAR